MKAYGRASQNFLYWLESRLRELSSSSLMGRGWGEGDADPVAGFAAFPSPDGQEPGFLEAMDGRERPARCACRPLPQGER